MMKYNKKVKLKKVNLVKILLYARFIYFIIDLWHLNYMI